MRKKGLGDAKGRDSRDTGPEEHNNDKDKNGTLEIPIMVVGCRISWKAINLGVGINFIC